MANEKEFIKLINKNKGIIYKICTTYSNNKDDKDDLAQDIIFNLWKSYGSYNKEYKFSTWMYRIALNVAISFYRQGKKSKLKDSFSERLVVFEESPDKKIEEDKNLEMLHHFIEDLKEIDKAIILLYLENKSYREMAEITGFTETNISTRINRIKERLRQNFKNN